MTTVEKRRSGRKSGGHRKHSDGGYSDTSSVGSFPDENDREVSNLTDRAFRSLCIGDEAVYNDSDLGLSSPCVQRDKQLAFSQHGLDRERDDLKRTAHHNFSLRVQQYEEDWIHGGVYGSEIYREPPWEVSGERTHGGVSAKFQHSFVETSQQERSLREEQLSVLSNGATEVNSQQTRSRSRVSSLIKAFNCEGQRDAVGTDDRFREWSDETSWDKSALMSIQRELSEFSTSYQQNLNSGHFPGPGPFSPPDASFYPPEVAAMAHMDHNPAASFMRSSHSKHSMSAQVNCNSNFFIHSEFSPFKVWRDHSRFPFQHGQVAGFMHPSEFPKWYETPMYRELSLQDPPQALYRGGRHSHLSPAVYAAPPRSTSTSMVIQKASAMEKRCESELAGHYPHRKKAQSLGPNKLPSQRPSTASPTTEMSRRVRDTISSVKAIQEKIKRISEQNTGAAGVMQEQGGYYYNNNFYPGENSAVTAAPNAANANANTNMTAFGVSQLLTPSANLHQEAETSHFQHYEVSAPPVEHAPVRAESRGATTDVRMSSYKSRATSLLFNLKDNRKRVKSTYSPTKFKGLEPQEKNKQPSILEPRETVIDIPDFPDPYNQFPHFDEPVRSNAAAHQYANQFQSSFLNSQTAMTHDATQYPGYTVNEYQTGHMAQHSGFPGFTPENYTSNQLANGQNLHEGSVSLVPNKQGPTNTGALEDDMYRTKINAERNQTREYLPSKTHYEQPSNEIFSTGFMKGDGHHQLKHSKQDYDVPSQAMYRQTYSQDTEKLRFKEQLHAAAFMERQEAQPSVKKEPKSREIIGAERSSHLNMSNQPQRCALSDNTAENPAWYGEPKPLAFQDKKGFPKYSGQVENSHQEYNWKSHKEYGNPDQEVRNQHGFNFNQDKLMEMQEKEHSKQDTAIPKGLQTQILQPIESNSWFEPDKTSDPAVTSQFKDRRAIEIKAQQGIADNIKAELQQAELEKVQVQLESAGLTSSEQTLSEKIRAEEREPEPKQQEMVKQAQAENTEEKKLTEESSQKQEVQKVPEEPSTVTTEPKHTREEQIQRVKAEQEEKEMQVKPEVPKVDLDTKRLKKTQLEDETSSNINADLFRKDQFGKVQTTTGQLETSQIRRESFNIEPTGTASRKAEQTSTEEMKQQQFKAEKEKPTAVKVETVKTDSIKSKEVRPANDHKDLVRVDPVNIERHMSSSKERKAEEKLEEQPKSAQIKMDASKSEKSKAQSMQERSDKLTAKLTATQPAKSEPDKVEQVKTELAKAKAELAKIKEKMRSEQKEKVKNTTATKEDGTATSQVPVQLNVNKTEENKTKKQDAQTQPQREIPVVRNNSREPDRGAEEYDRLREKYGFTDAVSPNKQTVFATENVSSIDNNQTQASSLDTPTKGKDVVAASAEMENNEGAGSLDSTEVAESQYVYSESAKEFKLSCAGDSKTKKNKEENGHSAAEKLKDESKTDKSDPVKNPHVSLHQHLDTTKPIPPKTKSHDHNFIPPKALPHKERTQTKQEILTSKIKAHAEKEISAIKEKGFALRDGSKSFGKLLSSSQSANIRQRPPSQDSHKKNETMSSSSVPTKHQMDPSREQLEPKSSTFGKSSTTPVKPSASSTSPEDHLLKQILLKSAKSNSEVAEQPREPERHTVDSANGLEKSPETESPMKTNEQAAKDEQRNVPIKHKELSGKQKEQLEETPAVKSDILSKKETTQEATDKILGQEAPREDSENPFNLFLGQKEEPAADDSLQIMGIMVTIRDRIPAVDTDQGQNSILKLKNTTEKESRDLVDEPEKTPASEETVKGNEKDKQQNHSAVQEDPTHKATLISETRKHKTEEDITETNQKQEGRSMDTKPQSETKAEPPAVNGVTVTALSKNKVSTETQALLQKQDKTPRETKDAALKQSTKAEVKTEGETPRREQTPQSNNNQTHKEGNGGIVKKGNSKTQLKHGVQPSVTGDETAVMNQPEKSNSDDKNTTHLEDKRHNLTTPIIFNQAGSSRNLTLNESVASPKHQDQEKHIGEKIKEDDDIHIDSISIKVVPATTTNHSKTSQSNEQITTAYKENTGKNTEKSKAVGSECGKNKLKDNSDDKLSMQPVLYSLSKESDSLKCNNSSKEAHQNIQLENAKLDNAKAAEDLQDESIKQPLEGDYFQIQRETETSGESHQAAVGDAVKERELPGMLNKESHKEGKSDAFVFKVDQHKSETAESDLKSFQEERVNRKHCETEDTLVSKQADGSIGKLSNNEKMETGQANQTRKHPSEHESSLSVTERHGSRRLHPKRENKIQENPEVKPKPKVSTIPEISALADYARLKVIVSEDKDVNPVQEFPPNKKEGFFPLIHTRHSRRPVFAAEPQQYSVKEKTLANSTETTAKANKEPKAIVFPITEKEHQRTGMFKLGDKERQDKMLSEVKVIENIINSAAKNVQHGSKNDFLTGQMEEMAQVGTQRVNHRDLNCFQPDDHHLQASTSSQGNSEGLTYLDKMAPQLATMGQIHSKKENITETEDKQKDRLKNEKLATQTEQRKAKQQEEMRQADEEQSTRSKDDGREEEMKIKHLIEERRASEAEEERKAYQREEERRASEREAIEIKIKRKHREMERRMEEERQVKEREAQRAQKEEEQRKEDIRIKENEEKMRIKAEEERRAAQEELQRRAQQAEQQRRAAQEEQQRRAAQEEQQRRAAQEEQQRRAAQEEQQRRAAQEEQQRRAAQEEQQRRAQQEQQRRAAQEEKQRRVKQEEQQRRAAEEEQQRRAQQEEQRRAAQQEQQRKAEQEEQRIAALEEQQRRAAQEEQQRRAAQEEQQRRAAQEEQQRRAAQEEQQRRAAQEEQQRRAAEEQQRKAAQDEQKRKVAQEQERRATQEKQRRAAQEEQQRIYAEQQQRRATQEKEQGGPAQGTLQDKEERRATRQEQQRQQTTDNEEEQRKNQREANKASYISKSNAAGQQSEDQRKETEKRELLTRIQHEDEKKNVLQHRGESQAKGQKSLLLEGRQAEVSQAIVEEQKLNQEDDEFQTKWKEEKEFSTHREKMSAAQIENQKEATQMDALQYYAITSAEPEKKPKEKQICSPLPSQQRKTPGLEAADWPYRPHAAASPASSLPRSTTSSPALGLKPSMFRVKDNTMRGSSFMKSVKPRFHKNFGEDLWRGSPVDRGLERGEDQEIMRRRTRTPIHPESGSNRLLANNEPPISRSVSSLDGYSAHLSYHRPYSRRSLVMDDDDSRSVFSTTSDGVESFATSAADLADIRGLYDFDRPESACSFSSDVSRSMGKPPTVPPKSEKALRRAQRLTTRRMKKELSKIAEPNPVELDKEAPIICSSSSSSTEVRSSNCHAVASPHFSPPVSLAHARAVGSSLPSSHAGQQSSHRSFHAFPHATGPISLPNSSAHANPAVTLPAAPKTVTHVPSSPTLHHVNHPAPVTQYQVESSYPQSYPLTQRKVLQDLGSGQYFVVDVPVEVKTKTFIDPQTGKYVQLNVRESGHSVARHQPQLQPQRQIKQQQLPLAQVSPASKPAVLYHTYPHNYQPAALKSSPSDGSSVPATSQPEQQSGTENHSCEYPAPETGQNTEGHRYSPEKTPYMDTVSDMHKRHDRLYSTHGSYECDTNSQPAGHSVFGNDNSANSQYQPREIITMSELEDFMEISDW